MSKGRIVIVVGLGIVMGLLSFQNCEMYQPNQLARDYASMTPTPTPTPGPDDVRYVLGGWTCGSTDLLGPAQTTFQIRSLLMDVTPTEARVLSLFLSSSCVRTQTYYPSYPNTSTMALVHGPTACSLCTPMQCYPLGAPNPAMTTTYSMTKTASTLSLSRVLSSVDANDPGSVYRQASCTTGQIETLVYIRQ